MLIDTHTHTHLDLITNDSDEINQIINKCKKEQIFALFNISVNYKSNLRFRKYKNVYFSAGIHPSEADNYDIGQVDEITKIAADEKCIGIGETEEVKKIIHDVKIYTI